MGPVIKLTRNDISYLNFIKNSIKFYEEQNDPDLYGTQMIIERRLYNNRIQKICGV